MPAASVVDAGAPPSVPLSFSNNFWGKSDLGVDPLLTRMAAAKTTNDELRAFYKARADLEEEYAKKLFAISRKPLGSVEMGTTRAALDVARGETENMGKQHALIAQQMRTECEEPLAAFAGGIKERRKIVQTGIDRLLKTKQGQTAHVTRCRDRYEQDCLRVKGYLAQGHMVMGQEERKNKAKLEKTQINMASNSQEYEAAVKVLEETTGRWNKDWKNACDKFQDLEEERLDFTKSSIWAFANIASTVCVSDDASCEKIRLALENCEVEKDITYFIKTCGTGQEIPDPPRYINFAKGDSDTMSEVSEDDNNYSVAQFSRTTNPAFRSSSPSHELRESIGSKQMSEEPEEPPAQATPTGPNSGRPPPLNYRQQEPNVPPNYSPNQHGDIAQVPYNEYPTDGMTMYCRRDEQPSRAAQSDLSASTRPPSRDDQSDYSNPSSFTSAEPMSGKTSPTKQPPTNGVGLPGMTPNASPDKSVQKKRSGFFSKSPFNANSPFRRKSKKEAEHPSKSGNWNPGASRDVNSSSTQATPTKQTASQGRLPFNRNAHISAPEGEEPADPRANFQLNIGPNVLDVASPDSEPSQMSTPKASLTSSRRGPFSQSASINTDDPVARALANLKQSSGGLDMSKRASLRQPVDSYHRVKTPAPDQQPATRPSALSSAQKQDVLAAQRGTPPPAYEGGRAQSALGVPQPAFTSKEMRARTENWGMGSSVSAPIGRPPSSMGMSRPASRDGRRSPASGVTASIPRSASPQPQMHPGMRSRSPAPGQNMRARSPAPPMQGQGQMRARSPAQGMGMRPTPQSQAPPQGGSGRSRQGMMNGRPQSSYGGQYDQAPNGFDDRRGRGMDPALRRERSKSMAAPGMTSGQQQFRAASPNPYASSRPRTGVAPSNMEMQLASSDVARYDGPGGSTSGVCFMARAMYSYSAAIPEELSFTKGDILAVLRLQDDGWWEAEVDRSVKTGGPGSGGVGLVPSNYLQKC